MAAVCMVIGPIGADATNVWIPTPAKNEDGVISRCWATRNPQKWITLLIYVFGFTFTTLTVTHSLIGRHGKAIFSEQVVLHPNSANNSNNSAFMIFHDLSSMFRLSPCLLCLSNQSQVVNRHTQPGNEGQDQPKHRLIFLQKIPGVSQFVGGFWTPERLTQTPKRS